MKNFFTIFFLNLKQTFKNQKLLYLIIFIFIVVSVCGTLFSLNTIKGFVYNNNTTAVIFKIENHETILNELDNFLANTKHINNVYLDFKYNNLPIRINYYGKVDKGLNMGEYFTDEQLKNGDNVIITPNYNFYKALREEIVRYDINSTISLWEDFTVIGESSVLEYVFLVPLNSVKDINLIESVRIEYDYYYYINKPNLLKENISKYVSSDIPDTNTRGYKGIEFENKVYSLVMSVGIINMAFAYFTILKDKKHIIGIYRISGMNLVSIFIMLFLECLLVFIIPITFAFLIFYIIFHLLKNPPDLLKYYTLFIDYVNIFSVYFLVFMSTFTISITNFLKQPINIKNKN